MVYQGWILILMLDRKLRKSLPFEITSAQLYSLEFRAFHCFTIVIKAERSGLFSVLTISVPFLSTKLLSLIFPLSKILSLTFKVLSILWAQTISFNLMGLGYTNLQIQQIKIDGKYFLPVQSWQVTIFSTTLSWMVNFRQVYGQTMDYYYFCYYILIISNSSGCHAISCDHLDNLS